MKRVDFPVMCQTPTTSAGPAEPPSGSRHDLTVGESGDFVGGVHLNVGIEEMYGGLVQMIFLF